MTTPQAIATPYSSGRDAPVSTFLTFEVESGLADLLARPVSLVVDAVGEDVGVTLGCGELAGTGAERQVVVPILSTEAGVLVGIGVLRQLDEPRRVVVEMYLVLSPVGEPITAPETSANPDGSQDAVDDDGSDAPQDEPEGGV